MPIDTHAAVRKLENGGFETRQAEALVEVVNGVVGEQASKDDIRALRQDLKEQREEFTVAIKELREEVIAAFKEQREEFHAALKEQQADSNALREEVIAALKEQREEFHAALKEQRADSNALREEFHAALKEQRADSNALREEVIAAFKEQREDFTSRFATKEDFAKLETRIEAASKSTLLGVLAIVGLLYAALQLWPP